MVHMISELVTVASAKTKYYEKLIISLQIISQEMWSMWNVRDWPFVKFESSVYLANYCTD